MHSDSLNYNDLEFPTVTGFYSVQRTTNAKTGDFVIDNRTEDLSSVTDLAQNTGLYSMLFSGGLINPDDEWDPTQFIYDANRQDQLDFANGASVLDLHDKTHRNAAGQVDSAFVLILQPITVPEPGTFAFLAIGLLLLGLLRRRCPNGAVTLAL